MHIAQCYSGMVPPRNYGGVERVVYWLVREFLAKGHKITLIADQSSQVDETLAAVNFISFQDVFESKVKLPADVDVVHFHNDYYAHIAADKPYVVTEHGNRKRFREHTRNTLFISESHARNHHALHVAANGIPKDEYPLSTEKDDYMLFLAKLGWRTKNAKTAINLALDSGMPLELTGGEIRNEYKIWGSWLLKALLKPGLIHNNGNVDGVEKLKLLQRARILFYLVNWQEPFALAPHEALACGTPVLASANGALAEYIEHGKNGFIVNNYQQAMQAIETVQAMTKQEILQMAMYCRETAYSIVDSADAYLVYYDKVISQGYLYTQQEAKNIFFDPPESIIIKK